MVDKEVEGWMVSEIKLGNELWWIVGMYVNRDMGRKKELMRDWMEESGEDRWVIMGRDFNVRTGKEGECGGEWYGEREEGIRKSKDVAKTGEGKDLCRFIKEREWVVMNGSTRGDEDEEWTFVGERGKSVINYVDVGEGNRKKEWGMEVGGRVVSGLMPIVVKVEGSRGKKKWNEKEREELRGVWTEEGIQKFREEYSDVVISEEEGVERKCGNMRKKIRVGLENAEQVREKIGRNGWWDEECRESKQKLEEELKRWKEGREKLRLTEGRKRDTISCGKGRKGRREKGGRERSER